MRNLGILLCLFFCLGIAPPQDQGSKPTEQTAKPEPTATATNAHYLNMSVPQVLALMDDPKSRINPDYRVPAALKPIVGFWLQIYAKYSLYQTMIYDRSHHEVIYEVVDNREFFQRGLSPIALEISIRNKTRKIMSGYQAAFKILQRNPRSKFKPGTPGAHLLSIWGHKSAADWRRIQVDMRVQPGQRDRIMLGLSNAERFLPAMEAIFRKYKIPVEITRVPLVESSFNLAAVSKADAVGVWQFLERSATEYLVVDPYNKIDERISPIKSTYAAAKMFKRNYKILDDWGLAIIAYNHGARNLIPIRKKYHGAAISKLLSMTKNTPLGYASRSYYAEFLAIVIAEKYRDVLYGMPAKEGPDAISIVRMKKPASVFEIAALYNISIHELRVFNPDIFDLKRKLPAGTRVVLPRKNGESLVAAPRIEAAPAPGAPTPSRGLASDLEFIDYIK